MQDWNVVVTVLEGGMSRSRRFLKEFGAVGRTDFFNILVMRTDDIEQLLERLRAGMADVPETALFLGRVVPVTHTFTFQTPEMFEGRAREIAAQWVPSLAGKGFHVRMHRRGFKGRISSMDEEKFLDGFLLEELEKAGNPGRITFADPDAIIAVETVGQRGGLSLWSRHDLQRYPFLRLD